MAFEELRETLETLEEISEAVSGLDPDLTDKKTISDVMLALEKILPALRQNLSHPLARLGEALSLLFEKFLMEMVEDGAPGLEGTARGVKIIHGALAGEGNRAGMDREADVIVLDLVRLYGVPVKEVPEAAAPIPGAGEIPKTPEPDAMGMEKSGGDEDDDFFAGMSEAAPRASTFGEPEAAGARNPVEDLISDIAGDVTMLDPDMLDKQAVSGIMLKLEGLSSRLAEQGLPDSVLNLSGALAALYEKSLMEGIENGARALELTSDGIRVISAFFEGVEKPEDVLRKAGEVAAAIKGEYGAARAAEAAQKARGAGDESKPRAHGPAEATPDGAYTIHVSTAEDLMLYGEFVHETSDAIHSIEGDLLELESNPGDMEAINHVFRLFHSLKGTAGFLGLSTINVLCHETETLLDRLRKREAAVSQEMIDAFLKAADIIKLVNEGLALGCEKAREQLPGAALALPRYNIDALLETMEDLARRGKPAEAGDETEKLGDILREQRLISEEQLEKALHTQDHKPLGQILVDMGTVDSASISDALRAQEEKRRKVRVSALKVDTEKLNALLELVGELVISQSIVTQDAALGEEINRGLQKNIQNLGKITKNIQDHVMGLRMVPLRQTFQKMSRLVRDLSKKMNKPAVFEVSGEDTEIDKTIIEELNDPLVHLLRNAMDHGLETPEERLAAGKQVTGRIRLAAYHRGGNVHIEISDDGRGLDREKILRKAAQKGLVAPEAEVSEHDVFNLIFLPGFSTHDVATDISGRGVGMDVVRSNIERLGGKVEIASRRGEGSTITVKLPLTMAIMDGMIVRIGAERFIIPTISIRESIRPRPEEVNTVKRRGEMVNVRGSLLPLLRLHDLLRVSGEHARDPWEGLVIIVENDDREYGLMVDDLLGQQQIVIKSLGRRFRGLPGISGGTILGDGRVGLILDVAGVVAMS